MATWPTKIRHNCSNSYLAIVNLRNCCLMIVMQWITFKLFLLKDIKVRSTGDVRICYSSHYNGKGLYCFCTIAVQWILLWKPPLVLVKFVPIRSLTIMLIMLYLVEKRGLSLSHLQRMLMSSDPPLQPNLTWLACTHKKKKKNKQTVVTCLQSWSTFKSLKAPWNLKFFSF